MDVSIIFVNFNTISQLINSIDSVFKHTKAVNYEIIVIDNNSLDASCDTLEKKYGKKIKLLQLPVNIGFGRANNEGINIAQGRNIFLLNPDTLLLNNAVKILSDYLDDHHDTGMVGGNIYNKEILPAYSFRHFIPSVFWEFNDLLFALPEKVLYGKNMHFNHTPDPVSVGYITGADLMIPRRILDMAGGFSPEFFLYFEEADLAYRVRKLKLRIINIPEARIVHLEGESFEIESERFSHYLRGKFIFYQKNYNKITRLILDFIIVMTLYSRMVIFRVLMDRTRLTRWRSQARIYSVVKRELKKNTH